MKKLLNMIKKCPFLCLLILSGVILTGVAMAGKNSLYKSYEANWLEEPELSVVFQGVVDGVYPWELPVCGQMTEQVKNGIENTVAAVGQKVISQSGEIALTGDGEERGNDPSGGRSQDRISSGEIDEAAGREENMTKVSEDELTANTEDMTPHQLGGSQADGSETGADGGENAGAGGVAGVSGNEGASPAGAGDGTVSGADAQGERKPSFVRVGLDYFEDALFIGDSRTVGLSEYSELKDVATFYAKTSLTIYDTLEKPIARTWDGRKTTVDEALRRQTFGKIYLMVGINELGTGTTDSFMEVYRGVVERLRELQPDALIFLQGIMRVSGKKSREDPIFNNAGINEKNAAIAELADGRKIFYIDVNEAVSDENGDLVQDYTADDVHLKAQYYEIWQEFLLSHGIEE